MKLSNVLGQQVIRVALIGSMALGGFPAMHAQQKVAATGTTAAREKSAGGRTEGIKVHGHWTITVRNADGSVASRNEFENSLSSPSGSDSLIQILGRTGSPGLWSIAVVQQDSAGAKPTPSAIIEPASAFTESPFTVKSLVISVDSAGVHLSGTTRATIVTATGMIIGVSTSLFVCPATAAPAAPCSDADTRILRQFTARTLSSGIPIQQNQSIDVAVTISFS